jgi:hypothetical protein
MISEAYDLLAEQARSIRELLDRQTFPHAVAEPSVEELVRGDPGHACGA